MIGNHTGPRQFELPPNSPLVGLRGLVVECRRDAVERRPGVVVVKRDSARRPWARGTRTGRAGLRQQAAHRDRSDRAESGRRCRRIAVRRVAAPCVASWRCVRAARSPAARPRGRATPSIDRGSSGSSPTIELRRSGTAVAVGRLQHVVVEAVLLVPQPGLR